MRKIAIKNNIAYTLTAFLLILIYFSGASNYVNAQKSDSVSVNYDALNNIKSFPPLLRNSSVTVNIAAIDELNPMLTRSRFLMPNAKNGSRRVILTPPSGIDRINSPIRRVQLRDPSRSRSKITKAPNIIIADPAPAAASNPTSLTISAKSSEKTLSTASKVKTKDKVESRGDLRKEAVAKTSTMDKPNPIQKTEIKLAALTPDATKSIQYKPVSVVFPSNTKVLPVGSKSKLDKLAETMKENARLRLKLLAYASIQDGSKSNVRRMSLSRALAMREYLLKQGVQSTKIEVRALGDKNDGGNPDRVDAIIESR